MLRAALLLSLAFSAVMSFVPFANWLFYPLLMLSTMVHEMGHGVAALLVGGNFESFHMWQDGSGVAQISGNFGRFARAFVAAGGLVGPAIAAMLLFLAAKTPRGAKWSLVIVAGVLLVAEILVVRGLLGLVYVGILALVLLGTALKTSAVFSQAVLIFGAVQLSMSVFSRADYLFSDIAHTANGPMPSDVSNMANALFLPYWFWGSVCAAISLVALVIGFSAVWQKKASLPHKTPMKR